MRIIFYGPEGSGKTTQAKMLSETLTIPHLGSGDLVRNMADNDKGIMGDIVRETMKKGHYVADTEMFVLWKVRLKDDDTQNGWIIDGFPRNVSQAEWLANKLDKYNQTIDKVFFLTLTEEETLSRLKKRGRKLSDGSLHDSEELIRERLRRYKAEEANVLSYYRNLGILVEINGEQTIETIHEEIKTHTRQ